MRRLSAYWALHKRAIVITIIFFGLILGLYGGAAWHSYDTHVANSPQILGYEAGTIVDVQSVTTYEVGPNTVTSARVTVRLPSGQQLNIVMPTLAFVDTRVCVSVGQREAGAMVYAFAGFMENIEANGETCGDSTAPESPR